MSRTIQLSEILSIAIEEAGSDYERVVSKCRTPDAVLARTLFVGLARKHTGHSFTEIAAVARRMNHSHQVKHSQRAKAISCGTVCDNWRAYWRADARVLALIAQKQAESMVFVNGLRVPESVALELLGVTA
jgi:hypothetical protein